MNIYEILKSWYEYKADNPEITGNHTDFLFYCVDLNNRLAWKEEFGLPSIETANFLGISYNTFRKILKDFVNLKLIRLVKESTNQYTTNIISLDLLYQNLLKQTKSTYKAFVKAQQKQLKSICNIDIHNIQKDIFTLLQIIQILLGSKETKDKNNITSVKEKDILKEFMQIANQLFQKEPEPTLQEITQIKHSNYTASFELFWWIYPSRKGRKQGKDKAYIIYSSLTKEQRLLAIKKAREYSNINGSDFDYAKDAFRWLKDKMFLD